MSDILKNTIVTKLQRGVLLNDAFLGIPYYVSQPVVGVVVLYPVIGKTQPITLDLATITLINVAGTDITPLDITAKAEIVSYFFSETPNLTAPDPTDPLSVNFDEVSQNDIDWEASDFTGWIGNERELFGNVNNGGIYNDTTDNPKCFILRFVRSKQLRVWGVGSSIGFHSNIKVTILGSGDTERGILDASADPHERQSTAYKEEQFECNALKVEFFTASRIDITNVFLKNQISEKKQNVIHKWGVNPDVDPALIETIWTLGDEYVFTETPQAYYISSSSPTDTQDISIETIGVNVEGRLQREIVTMQLAGQVQTLIPTIFLNAGCNRAFIVSAISATGDIYIYENDTVINGIPVDLTKVKAVVPAGFNQTRQAVYIVPEFLEDGRQIIQFDLYEYGIDLARQQSVAGEGSLIVQNIGGAPREQHAIGLSDNKISRKVFGENTPLIIDPGSRIYLNVDNITNNNTVVYGDFTGSLILL